MAAFSYFCAQITVIAAILILSSSIFASSASPTRNISRPFEKIYAFGDSFTDTGNTRSVSGPSGFGHVSSPPYGSTFFHHSTNRYSDGRLMIDFVAEALSLPFLPPYRYLKGKANHGVNFAVAGSTAINHAFFVKNNLTLDITPDSIQTQIIWFNEFLEKQGCQGSVSSGPECKAALEGALIWVGEIGVNDYAYITGSSVSGDTIRKLAISSVTTFLQALLSKGVKHVVVQECKRSSSSTHNAVYLTKLQDLRRKFPNATIAYLDYWNAYCTVIKNPNGYGFKEPLKACCGSGDPPYNFNPFAVCGTSSASACPNPAKYINWDGVHLTEAMYKVLTGMFLHGTYSHPPFGYLLDRKQREG
ncbi:hypothetical protein GH714_040572 [Hevea brasiliensis]|uniref:Uncharacterized protein n=1 Tax=Hevea brasiliensis TaxID=3981 RepID=A0A6A6KYR5_HEVBR|nr:hypothetical protein GH714_040572 [Hevea brasiliensis]